MVDMKLVSENHREKAILKTQRKCYFGWGFCILDAWRSLKAFWTVHLVSVHTRKLTWNPKHDGVEI